jgi:hypothetical protein
MQNVITLLPDQREVLAQALPDAVNYRDPPVYCSVCEQDTLCDECTAALARASSYLTLGRALGVPEAP